MPTKEGKPKLECSGCLNKEKKPINAAPMWHGRDCPLFLDWKQSGESEAAA